MSAAGCRDEDRMSIASEIEELRAQLPPSVRLAAVSKFHPAERILEAYRAGQRIFAESRPQELAAKAAGGLPEDIEWHFIGHLQTNKLKMVLPHAALIHSVDSLKLLGEINKYVAARGLPKAQCLLEVFIAREESKQGFDESELAALAEQWRREPLPGVEIRGLMGMASFVEDAGQIRSEFARLAALFRKMKAECADVFPRFDELSMGMSNDYPLALEYGSTLVRIGTRIFGPREY